MKKLFVAGLVISSFSLQASFFPKSWENVGASAGSEKSSINPGRYQEIFKELNKAFSSDLSENQATLELRFEMENDRVNAHAKRKGDKWIIVFNGGMLRHRHFDEEVFTAVLCHELGHHLGGAPYKFPEDPGRSWISAEGQADYFAGNICLKRLYQEQDNARYLEGKEVPLTSEKGCSFKHRNKDDYLICLRSSLMSLKTARFVHKIGNTRRGRRGRFPRLETPDTNRVGTTFLKHPKPQCRLDTFFQGGLCDKLIRTPYSKNPNCLEGEGEFAGTRPACWHAGN